MVHGSTFQMKDWQSNFPIAKEAAGLRGLDYLAIGDTHGFREYREGEGPPTVYPSAPECCTFGESDTGYVALVLIKSSRSERRWSTAWPTSRVGRGHARGTWGRVPPSPARRSAESGVTTIGSSDSAL